MHCVLREMDLTYEEDGWPSIPKITEFFAFSPMERDQIGKWYEMRDYLITFQGSKLVQINSQKTNYSSLVL